MRTMGKYGIVTQLLNEIATIEDVGTNNDDE